MGTVHVEVGDVVGVDLSRDGVVASGHPDVAVDPSTLDLTPAAVGAVVRVLEHVVGGGVLGPALDEVVEVAVDVSLGGNATAPVDLGGGGGVEVVGAEGVAAVVGGSANLGTGVGVVHLSLNGADAKATAAAASAEEVELVPSVGGEAADGLALVAAAHVLVLGAVGTVHVEVGDVVGVDLSRDGVVASGHPDVTEDPSTLDLTPAAVGAVVRVLEHVVGGGVLGPALDEVVEVA